MAFQNGDQLTGLGVPQASVGVSCVRSCDTATVGAEGGTELLNLRNIDVPGMA